MTTVPPATGRTASTLALALLLTSPACTSPSTPLPVASTTATVERVVDGDTIALVGGDRIRILGIDSPETHRPGTPVQCGGPEATKFAKGMLFGQTVTVVADPSQADRDRYGRLLRYIRLADGRDYSVEAARAGMARNYVYHDRPVREQDEIAAAEAQARAARRGLWGCP